jgi:ribosome maturation factor RimP
VDRRASDRSNERQVSNVTTIEQIAASVAADSDLTLYDIEQRGGVLAVLLNRQGGVDIDTLANASRALSRRLEADGLLPDSVTLEVSSPGLERKLRTEEHFLGAVGQRVTLTTSADGGARLVGTLTSVADRRAQLTDDEGVTHDLSIDSIDRARTVFEWGGSPPPRSQSKSSKSRSGARTNSEASK